jgi:Tfp pilus assembly protein PilF
MRKVLVAAIAAVSLLGACETQTASEPGQAVSPDRASLQTGLDAFKAGDLAGAERAFSEVLSSNPKDPFANLNMGAVKALTGRRDEAATHYQLAIDNGQGVPVGSTVEAGGSVSNTITTVAEVARGNLDRLSE